MPVNGLVLTADSRVCLHIQAENQALMHLVDVQQRRLATYVHIRVMHMMLLLNTAIWCSVLLLEKHVLSS